MRRAPRHSSAPSAASPIVPGSGTESTSKASSEVITWSTFQVPSRKPLAPSMFWSFKNHETSPVGAVALSQYLTPACFRPLTACESPAAAAALVAGLAWR